MKEKEAAGSIGSRERTRAARTPFGLALGGAGAAAKFTFYNETDGYHARLLMQVPQIVRRQSRERYARKLGAMTRARRAMGRE